MGKHVLFNDGEGVDYNDFNTMRKLLLRDWADTLLLDHVENVTLTGNDTDIDSLLIKPIVVNGFTFTPSPTGGVRSVAFAAGTAFLCSPTGTAGAAATALTATNRRVVPITFLGQTVTFAANSSGLDRWDMVYIDPAYLTNLISSDVESRDFEDAVTRLKTTTTPFKRQYTEAEVRAVNGTLLQVYPGTPGAGIPALPTLTHLQLCAVRIPNGAGVLPATFADLDSDYYDITFRRHTRRVTSLGKDARRAAGGGITNWSDAVGGAANTSISNTVASAPAYFFPGTWQGDPGSQLLRTVITHSSTGNFTAQLVRLNYTEFSETVLSTLNVGTTDGAIRSIYTIASERTWLNGSRAGRALSKPLDTYDGTDYRGTALAVKIIANSTPGNTIIHAVHFVLGTE